MESRMAEILAAMAEERVLEGDSSPCSPELSIRELL
jgi:hypothetical protein